MKFQRIPVAEAEGAILAHSLRLGDFTLRKGRLLSAQDVSALSAGGHDDIVAARLEEDDVAENEAARTLAEALAGPGLTVAEPFTGRVNLMAGERGLLMVEVNRLDAVNLVDESLTVATLSPYAHLDAGQIAATIKVIPFAAPAAALEAAVAEAGAGKAVLQLKPFAPATTGLITTVLPGMKDSLLDKAEHAVSHRVEALGGTVAEVRRCTHTPEAVADAVRELREAGLSPIFVLGASANVDRRDVVPAGIEIAGGTVEHFGMPVDPGNLLLLARLGEVPVVGVPGCARSPKLNGFDWVLERLFAGLRPTPEDIMRMGAGGLLKEFAGRPQPRQPRPVTETAAGPRIAAVVLAAGQSRRMGKRNKLLSDLDGTVMIARVVAHALASRADPVIVVTGHEAEAVRQALAGRDVEFVHNPDYASGLSTSLKAGIAAVPADADGAIACLGDMPRVGAGHMDKLIAAFDPEEGRAICVPTKDGKRGNPVLWGADLFADIGHIEGDVGARHIIGRYAELVCEVGMDDDAIFMDVDTPAALIAARGGGPAKAKD